MEITELTGITEIKVDDLNFRWVDGYYDGVLSGFVIWRERLCFFEIWDDSAQDRKFSVHSLSDEEAEAAIRGNEEFKARHGDHNDLLPDGSSAGRTCRTTLEEMIAAFEAGEYKPAVSYRGKPAVGWFTSATF